MIQLNSSPDGALSCASNTITTTSITSTIKVNTLSTPLPLYRMRPGCGRSPRLRRRRSSLMPGWSRPSRPTSQAFHHQRTTQPPRTKALPHNLKYRTHSMHINGHHLELIKFLNHSISKRIQSLLEVGVVADWMQQGFQPPADAEQRARRGIRANGLSDADGRFRALFELVKALRVKFYQNIRSGDGRILKQVDDP